MSHPTQDIFRANLEKVVADMHAEIGTGLRLGDVICAYNHRHKTDHNIHDFVDNMDIMDMYVNGLMHQ